jgi:hypothetical protein
MYQDYARRRRLPLAIAARPAAWPGMEVPAPKQTITPSSPVGWTSGSSAHAAGLVQFSLADGAVETVPLHLWLYALLAGALLLNAFSIYLWLRPASPPAHDAQLRAPQQISAQIGPATATEAASRPVLSFPLSVAASAPASRLPVVNTAGQSPLATPPRGKAGDALPESRSERSVESPRRMRIEPSRLALI